MDMNQLTEMVRSALNSAQTRALCQGHQQVDVEHLLAVLLEQERGLAERRMDLELTEHARAHLVRVGYDPHYEARPLKRAIQREVENPLAQLIVSGELRDGTHLRVDYEIAKQELVFS